MRITLEKVERVKRVLATGVSAHRASVVTRVHRSTVDRIKSGTFCLFAGPFAKCPTCGAKVKMPCLCCSLKKEEKRKVFGGSDWDSENLGLDLSEGDMKRYEKVVKRKRGEPVSEEGLEVDQDPATSPCIDSEGWFAWDTI